MALRRLGAQQFENIIRYNIALTAWATEKGIPMNAFQTDRFDEFKDACQRLHGKSVTQPRSIFDNVIPALSSHLRKTDLDIMKTMPVVVSVVDGWTAQSADKAGRRHVMGELFTGIDLDWKLQTVIANFDILASRSSAVEADWLKRNHDTFLPLTTTVALIVGDGAERSTAEKLELDRWWCVAHRASLLMKQASERSGHKEAWACAKPLVNLVKSSDVLQPMLICTLAALGQAQQPSSLLSESDTRWTSRYDSIQRLLDLWDALCVMKTQGKFSGYVGIGGTMIKWPESSKVETLKACQPLLKPVVVMITALQEENVPTLSSVPTHLRTMLAAWSAPITSCPVAESLRVHLLSEFNTYFPNFFSTGANWALIAAALDPRYTDLQGCSEQVRDNVWDAVLHQIVLLGDPTDDMNTAEIIKPACVVLRKALKDVHDKTPIDPLEWWRERAGRSCASAQWAQFGNVARVFLAAPATSAAIERCFKSLSFIEEGRQNLSSGRLFQQAIIRNSILNGKYDLEAAVSALKPTPM